MTRKNVLVRDTKHQIEIKAPLKFKIEAKDSKRRKVKVTFHKQKADGKIVNTSNADTEEKSISVVVDTFDDGSEEVFLIFKRYFVQMIDDQELIPSTDASGAKHLYTLMKRALNGNVLEE